MTSAFLLTTWSMKPGSWWLKPLWSCRQTWTREQVVQRRRSARAIDVPSDLQPLRVLVEHRIDDVDERLVAVEEAVAAGEEVALEPALAEVLREDLHDPAARARAGRRAASVSAFQVLSVTSRTASSRFDAVSSGPNKRKVSQVRPIDVAQELPRTRVASAEERRAHRPDGVVAEVRQREVAEQEAAVGVRVGAHAAAPAGASSRELGDEAPWSSKSSSGR